MQEKSDLDFAADAVIRRAKILARAQQKVTGMDPTLLNILTAHGGVLVLAAEDEVRKMRGDY